MTIDTKFCIGEEVYFVHSDKLLKGTIETMSISVSKNLDIFITYYVRKDDDKPGDILTHFSEDKLFGTKEELIKDFAKE